MVYIRKKTSMMKLFGFLLPFLSCLALSCELIESKDVGSDTSQDTIPPVLRFNGAALDTAFLFTRYIDPGVKLMDEKAGDLFIYKEGKVETNGEVNTRLPGTYIITYTAKDAAGNSAIALTRTVNVVENSTTFLNGNYSVVCSCSVLPQGSTTPSLVSTTYTAAVLSTDRRDGFEISRLNLGPVNVMPGAHLNGSDITLSYYDRDLNYTDGSEEVFKNTLSASKTSFTIETKVMPWSPLVSYHCKNVYTKKMSIGLQEVHTKAP
jgi:hypothetical protein